MSELDKEALISGKGDLQYVVVGQSDNGHYLLEDPDTGKTFEFAVVNNDSVEVELRALDRLGYRWDFGPGRANTNNNEAA